MAERTRRATEWLRYDPFSESERIDAIETEESPWTQLLHVLRVHVVEIYEDQLAMFPIWDGQLVRCVERLLECDFVDDSHAVPHPDPLALDHLTCGVHDVAIALELALAVNLGTKIHYVVLYRRAIVAADREAEEIVREKLGREGTLDIFGVPRRV